MTEPKEQITTPAKRARRPATTGRTRATPPQEDQPAENPYQQLGGYFLMDQAALTTQVEKLNAESGQETTQIARDALSLRRIINGELGVPRPSSAVNQGTIRYLLTLLEETSGVAKPEYQTQHEKLTEYLAQLIKLEKEREAHLATFDTSNDGLPKRRRDGSQTPHAAFGTEQTPSGVDKFLADRTESSEPQEPPQDK